MIIVAIIGILAAVAVPSYLAHIRRSRLSEATGSIAAIKQAEESYFSINNCYIVAPAHPAAIPVGGTAAWDPIPVGSEAWGNQALAVRPDMNVRFQYRVFASNQYTAASNTACDAPTLARAASTGAIDALATASGCPAAPNNVQSALLIPAAIFPDHWYIITAQANQDGDGTNSILISSIDNSNIIMCNDTE